MNCKECGSGEVNWHLDTDVRSGVVDGRIRSHDISIIAYLGCDSCSETLQIIESHDIEEKLNRTNQ